MEAENASYALYHYLQLVEFLSLTFLNALTLRADFQKTHLPSGLSLIVSLAGPRRQPGKQVVCRKQTAEDK